jgi:hypothetical protein
VGTISQNNRRKAALQRWEEVLTRKPLTRRVKDEIVTLEGEDAAKYREYVQKQIDNLKKNIQENGR